MHGKRYQEPPFNGCDKYQTRRDFSQALSAAALPSTQSGGGYAGFAMGQREGVLCIPSACGCRTQVSCIELEVGFSLGQPILVDEHKCLADRQRPEMHGKN
jgi:hypothetical protein